METHIFTAEELKLLKDLCGASKEHGVDWVRAVSAFPAETEEEKIWKERMLAGIRIVEEMISNSVQTDE